MLHQIVHRLDMIERTLKAIEQRMHQMDDHLKNLVGVVADHLTVVNETVTDLATLSAQIATANTAGDTKTVDDLATQIQQSTDALKAAIHPVQAAVTAAVAAATDPTASASPPAGSSPA